jgi:hypothetical protein
MRRIGAIALAVLALAALATYLAGEQTELAVLRTFDAGGAAHETKMWVIDVGDTPWVRVANPERAWYQRLLTEPRVELVRGGRVEARVARPSADPTVRRAVDEAFAEKYGLVDAWYGLLLRRGAVPVRLEPAETATAPLGAGPPGAAVAAPPAPSRAR